MIVNRYKNKFDLVWGEDPLYLCIMWKVRNVVEKYLSSDKYAAYERWIKKHKDLSKINAETERWLENNYDKGKLPLFSSVEIEIINRCNGECPFCPVNRHDDIRKLKRMDDELFKKIIDELGEMDYSGRLALHSNNEPFLDKRIIQFAKYAREKVPHAFIYMYTNGTLLTIDKFQEIIPSLDRIVIDNYSDELKLHANAQAIHELCKKDAKLNKKVEIHVRKIHEILNTRGGQSPNNGKKEILKTSCILPYKQMIIRPDGKTSLCCNDPYGKYTMADLNKMTLKDAWYSDRYMRVRKSLRKGRKNVGLCKYCDTLPAPRGY